MTDLGSFLVAGKGADSLQGFQPEFSSALTSMFSAAPPEVQSQLRIASGFRTPERQAQLWQQALTKYGSPEAARKWVAPPGRSQHNHGNAADLRYLNPSAMQWAHQNAGKFGLSFPLGNENWHIELAGARGGQTAPVPHQALPMMAQGVTPQPQALTMPEVGPSAIPRTPTPAFGPSPLGSLFADLGDMEAERAARAEADKRRRAALFGA